MKTWRYFFLVIVITIAGCFEINEQIVINENGSGTYTTKMDLSGLLELMQTMASEEDLAKQGFDKAIDTTILMKSILDTAKDATPEQKELLKDGKMNLKMNIKEKIFVAEINLPYKNLAGLQALMSGDGGGAAGVGELFKTVFDKGERKEQPMDGPKEPGLDDLNTIFDVTVKNGFISKQLNQEKYKTMTEKPEVAQMKSMGGSGMEIFYTTTIKLPRPVKKSEGQFIKLSDDKKTVTLKYNLLEVFETPEKFSYTIEY